MTGDERREKIIEILSKSDLPISGTELGKMFNVSRQAMVQDIALIRSQNHEVIATHQGYTLNQPRGARRVFLVRHPRSKLQDELNTIVDFGGKVINVMVEHDVYGTIEGHLNITSRLEVTQFLDHLNKSGAKPLNTVTDGAHYHMVEADSEDILDLIERSLDEQGFLIKE